MSEQAQREAITHELKCDHDPFQEILTGRKKAEVRRDDRDYQVGDRLNLLETVNTADEMRAGAPLEYTSGQALKVITHVQRGYGLPHGVVVLSFADEQADDFCAALAQQPQGEAVASQSAEPDMEQVMVDLITHGISVQRIAPADFLPSQSAEPVALTQALQDIGYEFGCPVGIKITDWLRLRLAQPKAAIAAIRKVKESLDPDDWCGDESMIDALERAESAIATPPAASGAQGLTDEQIDAAWLNNGESLNAKNYRAFARAFVRDLIAQSAPAANAPNIETIGTLCVEPDPDATFGYCYDISTNAEGHARLRALNGAQLYLGAPAPSASPAALAMIREKLERFEVCAGDENGCDIGREWFDALTTLGLLERTQRSPAMWSMTPAGESLLAASPADQGEDARDD